MPAKGSTLKHGNRDYIFDREFYKALKEKNPKFNLSYIECSKIIRYANKQVAQVIENEDDGFKLPFGLGYISVVKYVPTNAMIDWKSTEKAGKHVYYNNFHTLGYSVKLGWFRVGRISNSALNETWKFVAMSPLSSAVSNSFSKGKNYQAWTHTDFIEKGRLENMYNKKYRKELKD